MMKEKTEEWKTMEKEVFMRLIMLCTLLCAMGLYVPVEAVTYNQENSEERFNAIKEVVIDSSKSVSNYGAEEAYDHIKLTLVRFRDLHQQVKEAVYIDDIIDEVTDSLDEIATTYEDVANQKLDISRFRKREMSRLHDAKTGTYRTVMELRSRKKIIITNTASMREAISSTKDEIEKQKLEISIKGNESIIHSLEAQNVIWKKFLAAQKKLLAKLDLNGRNIDLLLHVLKTNAAVYREAANVAQLRRSAKDALKNLQSLSDIQGILDDLQNSWVEVNDLVSEISNADFNIDLQ